MAYLSLYEQMITNFLGGGFIHFDLNKADGCDVCGTVYSFGEEILEDGGQHLGLSLLCFFF